MVEFIQLLFISSLWIWGIHFIFKPNQILGLPGDVVREWPRWIYKPTIGCPQCMASIHGTIIYLIAHSWVYDHGFSVLLLIPFIICLSGLNHIITEFLYDTTED